MRIFSLYISDVLLLQENVRSNIKTVNVSEALSLTEKLTYNWHFLNVHEKLIIGEKLQRVGGIFQFETLETLDLAEDLKPRVYVFELYDVLPIKEHLRNTDVVDSLDLDETLTFDVRKVIHDSLVLKETLGLKVKRNLIITEELIITEGLVCLALTSGRPRLLGTATNTKSVTLSSLNSRYTVTLRSPDYGNTEGLTYTRVNKKTRGGDLIVFRDPEWPKTTVYTYAWSHLLESERRNLLLFLSNTLGQVINLLDYEGNTRQVYVKNPETDFTKADRAADQVKIEFELK